MCTGGRPSYTPAQIPDPTPAPTRVSEGEKKTRDEERRTAANTGGVNSNILAGASDMAAANIGKKTALGQ